MPIRYKTLDIPANLDLEELLQQKPPHCRGINCDYLAYICHALINLKTNHGEDAIKKNGMVRLYSKILHQKVYTYRACLDYFISSGVIVTDNAYVVGEESKGYNFTDAYIGMGFKEYEVKSLQFKRTLFYHEQNSLNKRSKKQPRHLQKYFEDRKLELDESLALEWIDQHRKQCLRDVLETSLIKEINDKHDCYSLSVKRFNQNKAKTIIDDTSYRFHSVLTNIKSELRNFITYDGQRLVSLDIKNSQPYFSLIFFNSNFYSCSRNREILILKKIHPMLFDYLKNSQKLDMIKRLGVQPDSPRKGFIAGNYKEEVVNGAFYESMIKRLNLYQGEVLTRDESKKLTFVILFGDPKSNIKNISFYKIFKLHYPREALMFETLKSREVIEKDMNVGYRDFSIILQRIESHLVVTVITKEFTLLYPEAPIFTIHDCIVTTEEYANKLNALMDDKLKAYIGEIPKIKKEQWHPDIAFKEIFENSKESIGLNEDDSDMI